MGNKRLTCFFSGSGNLSRSPYGFTLVELLVSLALIGIIISLAVFSVSGKDSQERLYEEALRLKQLLELSRQNSIFEGQENGLRLYAGGYSFMRLNGNRWQAVTDENLFRPRTLPAGIQMQLHMEAAVPGFGSDPQQVQVMLFSSGEVTPFECLFSSGKAADGTYRLRVALNGDMTVYWDSG